MELRRRPQKRDRQIPLERRARALSRLRLHRQEAAELSLSHHLSSAVGGRGKHRLPHHQRDVRVGDRRAIRPHLDLPCHRVQVIGTGLPSTFASIVMWLSSFTGSTHASNSPCCWPTSTPSGPATVNGSPVWTGCVSTGPSRRSETQSAEPAPEPAAQTHGSRWPARARVIVETASRHAP